MSAAQRASRDSMPVVTSSDIFSRPSEQPLFQQARRVEPVLPEKVGAEPDAERARRERRL